MKNTICSLLDDLAVFAASGTGSAEQIEAYGFGIRGLEQGARVATVKLAIGCLRRYANGDKQKFFNSGDDKRLKNYYSVFNGLVSEGYAPATQLSWFSKVENNFSAVYGQSKKAAIAALREAGILEKPATPAAPAAGAPAAGAPAAGAPAGEITVALSDADRAGNIAAELIGQMSPAVFDLLAAAVAVRMAADTAAQQRRDAAAAEKQAAADTAAAAKKANEDAAAHAAHIGELRRAADAADLAAVAADQAAKLPDATAATKKRAARLLKKAQAAGAAYQAAVAA